MRDGTGAQKGKACGCETKGGEHVHLNPCASFMCCPDRRGRWPSPGQCRLSNQFQTCLVAAEPKGATAFASAAFANAALDADPNNVVTHFAMGTAQFRGAAKHRRQGLCDHGLAAKAFSDPDTPTVTNAPCPTRADLAPDGRCHDPNAPFHMENPTKEILGARRQQARCHAAENARRFGGIGDLVALVHLFRWPVVAPARL